MYSEESLLVTAWSLSSRRTIASVAAAAAAVTAASSGQNKRDREIEQPNVDDDDADATAANSIPHGGAMTSIVTRLLPTLHAGE
jgi:hypothetical protein